MVELVPAVCPKCGADLELPSDLKIGHCMYCGTKVIIEESKPDVHYRGTGTVENYLKLAERKYLELRKGQKRNPHYQDWKKLKQYCDKILEIDADNIRARELWLYAEAGQSIDNIVYEVYWGKDYITLNDLKNMKSAFSDLLRIYEKILSISPNNNFIEEKKRNVGDVISEIDNSRSLFSYIRNPLIDSTRQLKPIDLFKPRPHKPINLFMPID